MGSSSTNGNFGAGIAIRLPASILNGDLLIAVVGANGTPASWTTPAGWTAGAGGAHPDGQGLIWWWKVATSGDATASVTLKSASYADGGGVVLDYRGTAAAAIAGAGALTINDNNANGTNVASVGGVSWSGAAPVISLVLMSWQTTTATITWPAGYALQASANDGYGYVAVGANLRTRRVSVPSR
jgi:hypothetical protein